MSDTFVGWFALGLAILFVGIGVFMFCYMIHWAGKWLGNQEPSAELKAIQKLARGLGVNIEDTPGIYAINKKIREDLKNIKNGGNKS